MCNHSKTIIMECYKPLQIKNIICGVLLEGGSVDYALGVFLKMKISNDLPGIVNRRTPLPSLSDVCLQLEVNGTISKKDCQLEQPDGRNILRERLVVRLGTNCFYYIENLGDRLHLMINNNDINSLAGISFYHYRAEDIAALIFHQKIKLNSYLTEWGNVLCSVSKMTKRNRMAFLGIKAIFSEAMKDYPHVQYEFVEQQRRARILVRIPDSNLGVYIDGWWGSYKQKLPEQIAGLKQLIKTHQNNPVKKFYITKRK